MIFCAVCGAVICTTCCFFVKNLCEWYNITTFADYINNLYKDDNEMISFSLKEQEIEREINRLSFLKKRKDDHII